MQKPWRWPQINDTSEAQEQGNKNNGIISNAKHQPRKTCIGQCLANFA